MRIAGLGIVFAGLLIIVAVVALDAAAVGWARSLPAATRSFFRSVTPYGKSEWVLVPSGVLCLVLLLGAWRRAGRRVAAAWTEIGAFAFFLFAAVAGAGLTTDLIKWLVGRSRPGRFDTDGVLTLTPFAWDSIHFSFPSGHATTVTAAAVAAILCMRRLRWLGAVLLAAAATIAVSRVAVRAHFPSDVVGGITVGTLFTVWLASALGRTGVAFQRLPGGGLMAKTDAVRSVFRRRGAVRRMASGLAAALAPGRGRGIPG